MRKLMALREGANFQTREGEMIAEVAAMEKTAHELRIEMRLTALENAITRAESRFDRIIDNRKKRAACLALNRT